MEILAWSNGYYAIPFNQGGSMAVIRPDGWPVFGERAAEQIERPGWRIVRVELDEEGRCKRCAHLQRHPEQRPPLAPVEHTYNGPKPKWKR